MDTLTRLGEMTEDLVKTRDEVARLKAQLSAAKSHEYDLENDLLPGLMRENGQDMLKLSDGNYVELTDVTEARIPKTNPDAAYDWLEANGEGGMIKRVVVVEFRKDQEEDAKQALNLLREAGFNHAYSKRSHAWNTFQAWVESQFKDGRVLPNDILGINTHTRAVVTKGKKS